MRAALFFAVVVAVLPVSAADPASWSVREDPPRDQAYLVDTGGLVDGPCHAPAADIRRLVVSVVDGWITVEVALEDLADTSVRCGALLFTWDEPDVHIGLHGRCVAEMLMSCSTLPGEPHVQFFAERWYDSWSWNTVITRADGTQGNCFFGLLQGENMVGWRMPVEYAGDDDACRGFAYSLKGVALTPAGYAISWGHGSVPVEDTVVGPSFTIDG